MFLQLVGLTYCLSTAFSSRGLLSREPIVRFCVFANGSCCGHASSCFFTSLISIFSNCCVALSYHRYLRSNLCRWRRLSLTTSVGGILMRSCCLLVGNYFFWAWQKRKQNYFATPSQSNPSWHVSSLRLFCSCILLRCCSFLISNHIQGTLKMKLSSFHLFQT